MQRLKDKLKKIVKRSDILFGLYKKVSGYNPNANMWCRIVMDDSTNELIGNLPYQTFSVLEISGDKWSNFGFKNYKSLHYPDFDVCSDRLQEQYDLIIAEQVFEHLLKPYSAGNNVYRHLKNGGYLLVTTPFMIKIHPSPHDCTRWSKTGMHHFLEEFGFKNIHCYSWGNKACVQANFNKWTLYNPKRHSLKNEENFPLVVWALAQK